MCFTIEVLRRRVPVGNSAAYSTLVHRAVPLFDRGSAIEFACTQDSTLQCRDR